MRFLEKGCGFCQKDRNSRSSIADTSGRNAGKAAIFMSRSEGDAEEDIISEKIYKNSGHRSLSWCCGYIEIIWAAIYDLFGEGGHLIQNLSLKNALPHGDKSTVLQVILTQEIAEKRTYKIVIYLALRLHQKKKIAGSNMLKQRYL